jgi:hypothetical protein
VRVDDPESRVVVVPTWNEGGYKAKREPVTEKALSANVVDVRLVKQRKLALLPYVPHNLEDPPQ